MSKKILIVESDTSHSAPLRQALEGRGFTVAETTDGKGCVELIRRERPDLAPPDLVYDQDALAEDRYAHAVEQGAES